ncbi:MAG: polyprenyl synthetase family protein [bacterium]|nr:polyprenyl synthetase family protein [bacterium]
MRYAVLAGGKRLRPLIVIAACEAAGGAANDALAPGAAIEMLHTYSLVHDDLPAMDDDDLRRGRPTLHKVFGDAVAVLAGDALHTLAFEILGRYPERDDRSSYRADAVVTLARAAGVAGMVGGQIADLEAEGRPPDGERLRWIHRHKTGALFSASAEIGALAAGAGLPAREALARFGAAVGLAFQIADDILDETSTAEALGKTPGKDMAVGKATYPALYGLDASRAAAREIIAEGVAGLREHGLISDPLDSLAEAAVARSR